MLGALISIEAIWIMTAILLYSAVNRIKTLDFDIQSHTMVTLSCCAILVNIAYGLNALYLIVSIYSGWDMFCGILVMAIHMVVLVEVMIIVMEEVVTITDMVTVMVMVEVMVIVMEEFSMMHLSMFELLLYMLLVIYCR